MRSDDAAEFGRHGEFAETCRSKTLGKDLLREIDQTEYNAFAERGIAMIDSAGLSPQMQSQKLFLGVRIPSGDLLWLLRNLRAATGLNCTATRANKGN